MLIVFYTETGQARVINQEIFARHFIQEWFEKIFTDKVAKEATEELMSTIELNPENSCIVKFRTELYSCDLDTKYLKHETDFPFLIDYYEEIEFGKQAVAYANDQFLEYVRDLEHKGTLEVPVISLASIIAKDDGSISFVEGDSPKSNYGEVVASILSYYFSTEYVRTLSGKICTYFNPAQMLHCEKGTEEFYIAWDTGELQLITSDTPTTKFGATYRKDIEDILVKACFGYNRFLKTVCDSLEKYTFNNGNS